MLARGGGFFLGGLDSAGVGCFFLGERRGKGVEADDVEDESELDSWPGSSEGHSSVATVSIVLFL